MNEGKFCHYCGANWGGGDSSFWIISHPEFVVHENKSKYVGRRETFKCFKCWQESEEGKKNIEYEIGIWTS